MTEANREPLLKLLREAEGGNIISQRAAERLRMVVRDYLRGLVATEGNLIGPTALREANWLYGYAELCKGLAETIAEAFGVSRPRLAWMLARERQICCAECGREFTVREPRKKGGYTESQETICKACKRKAAHRRADSPNAWHEARAMARLKQRQMEQEILACLVAGQSPLQSEPFRRHLITYALHWSLGGPDQYTFNQKVPIGPGCMICGREPLALFVLTVAKSRQIPQDAAIVQRMIYIAGEGEDEDSERPPLLSLYQALCRMSPRAYFGGVPFFPLCDLPVLLLCAECGTGFANSHDELEVGEIQVEPQGSSGVRVKAGDVVYEVRQNTWWW